MSHTFQFNPFKQQAAGRGESAGAAGSEKVTPINPEAEATMNNTQDVPNDDTVKNEEAAPETKNKWWAIASAAAVGTLAVVAIGGVTFIAARALRGSDSAVVAATGEAAGSVAEAIVEGASEIANEAAAAFFKR
jgi:hypothetical protein